MTELINKVTDKELKQMALGGTVETVIADSRATSSCRVNAMLDCGRYKWHDPFILTG